MCQYFVIFACSDDVWKIHRKSLNYSFNLKILQSFIPTFIENAQKLVNDLSVNVDKTKEFDMLAYTTKSALNMICGEWQICNSWWAWTESEIGFKSILFFCFLNNIQNTSSFYYFCLFSTNVQAFQNICNNLFRNLLWT